MNRQTVKILTLTLVVCTLEAMKMMVLEHSGSLVDVADGYMKIV